MKFIGLFSFLIFSTTIANASRLNFKQNLNQPIKITPISQYACQSNSNLLNLSNNHYYFSPLDRPSSMPANETQYVCHDRNLYGEQDSPLYPRLNLQEGIFSLWSKTSNAFLDLNNNDKADVNDYMEARLLFEYGINTKLDLFTSLDWQLSPIETESTLGYFMLPFVNQNTGLSFCPKSEHYNGADPIFKILGDIIGAETEAIYISKREPNSLVNDELQTEDDYLVISETQLKQVSFYIKNGQLIKPNEYTASYHELHFFYPLDLVNPYVQKAGQKIYTVKSLQNGRVSSSDKRIGCIPKVNLKL